LAFFFLLNIIFCIVRFLDIYQVTQALNTVLTNQKQLMEMRRSWAKIDFDSVRNQSALVCNCRHSDLVQLLEHDFVAVLDGLMKSPEPVRDIMSWADKCCERLMGPGRTAAGGPGGSGANGGNGVEDRSTMSSRSVLIRWGYVTSQIMRDLVRGWNDFYLIPFFPTVCSFVSFWAVVVVAIGRCCYYHDDDPPFDANAASLWRLDTPFPSDGRTANGRSVFYNLSRCFLVSYMSLGCIISDGVYLYSFFLIRPSEVTLRLVHSKSLSYSWSTLIIPNVFSFSGY
jgi:hypothetical protein